MPSSETQGQIVGAREILNGAGGGGGIGAKNCFFLSFRPWFSRPYYLPLGLRRRGGAAQVAF